MGAANSDREIVVSRVFDAPRELVFEAWTTQEHMNAWWGPHGFTNTFHSYDMRPGGVIRFIMHGPDGENYPNRITFREIVPPERIVYAHDADRDGDPWSSIVTALFLEEGDQTRLTLTMTFSSAEVAREVSEFGAIEGGQQTLERLAAYLEQKTSALEIVMTRVFDAPRELVFDAYTKCEHLQHWWGPRRFTLKSCDLDLRVGGKWRLVQAGPDGGEYGFRGEYREIVRPEKIVWTFEFEGMPGHISLDTMTLEEHDGRTTLTSTSRFANAGDRDGMIASGMEAGAKETYDRLAEYLPKLAQPST